MKSKVKCAECGRMRRCFERDGRPLCELCLRELAGYRRHWFVRELEFKANALPPLHKHRKSLPGQLGLFE